MSIVDTVLHKVFGTPHERKVKQLRPVIEKIHAARMALEALDDAALAAKSAEFREKLNNGGTLEDIKVDDVDLSLVGSVTTMDIYEYLHFVMKDRDNSASARSRKISALRSYY